MPPLHSLNSLNSLNGLNKSVQNRAVWIVDDDSSIRWVLEKALTAEGIVWRSFANVIHAQAQLRQETPAVVLSDVRMPGVNGLEWLAQLKAQFPQLPVIIMTAFSDLDTAVSAFQQGAYEYLPKPFDIDPAIALVRRALQEQLPKRSSEFQDPVESAPSMSDLLGQAPAMQAVFRSIGKLALSNATVLITGESGTGKELVAQALHRHSVRKNKPFIAINTSAIPKDLLESELFGHERGAFTGAAASRKGRFEQAEGGTLFLDEIGDMPSELQTRLLRVLAEGAFYRVGGTTAVKVDVRVIAATHQALEARVEAGLFREDLFHRLNVIRLRLPALRERAEDVGLLAQHFLTQAAQKMSVEIKVLEASALRVLREFSWPGNVRQLENVCQWLTVMAPAQQVSAVDLPPELQSVSVSTMSIRPAALTHLQNQTQVPRSPAIPPQPSAGDHWQDGLFSEALVRLQAGETGVIDVLYAKLEKAVIRAALQHTQGHKSEAAQLLGLGRNTLARKAQELGL